MLSVVQSEGNMPDVRGPENRPVILIIFLSLRVLTRLLSVKKRPASLKNALKPGINKVRSENYSANDVRLLGQIK